MAKTRAQEKRAIRQEALREWLSVKCMAQHLIDTLNKIEQLDTADETFRNQLDKHNVANEQRLKIMNTYLPDVRTVELTGEAGEAIQVSSSFEFIPVGSDT